MKPHYKHHTCHTLYLAFSALLLCLLAEAQGTGTLNVDVTDSVGNGLRCRVSAIELETGARQSMEIENGVSDWVLPAGTYRAYVEVYERGVPILVEAKDVTLAAEGSAYLLVSLIEWGGESLTLRDFDYDGDLAIDRVELASGTDPNDAASIPGRPMLTHASPVLTGGARWYRGELFAQSDLGTGKESVKKLIARAAKEKMDFLAIADRGHMKSIEDPDYKSDKVVLIPAMQWGRPCEHPA